MSRFSGMLGIRQAPENVSPGVNITNIEEIKITGNTINLGSKWTSGELTQENASVTLIISVVASKILKSKMYDMVYVLWNNKKWSIIRSEDKHPRIVIYLGGLYHDG